MAQIEIEGNSFDSYASLVEADQYLVADVKRSATWGARSEDDKKRGLISATRLLLRLSWAGDVPSFDDIPEPVIQSAAILAEDILTEPDLSDDSSTASNIKRVGAGPASVEFFRPSLGAPAPTVIINILGDLLGSGDLGSDLFSGRSYGSDSPSRFDPTNFGLRGSLS